MFEQLYRIAREVQAHPRRVPALLLQLLRDLFDPLQSESDSAPAPARARIDADGTMLVVPIESLVHRFVATDRPLDYGPFIDETIRLVTGDLAVCAP